MSVTGTQAEVDAAQQAVGTRPARQGGAVATLPDEHAHESGPASHTRSGPLGYAVGRTNVIFGYDADDRLPVLHPTGVTPGDLAADLPRPAEPIDPPSAQQGARQ